MKYLIDTDWIIDHFRGVELITKKLENIAPQGVAISIISLAEIYEGIFTSKEPAKSQQLLDEFLAPDLKVLSINEDICRAFGRERTKLRKKKQLIGDLDLLIASTALHYNLTILTNNLKHFEKVEGLKISSIKE
ncbi:MAG: type II toxin-antitoxin system VapC family toxin [Candidatus Jettenia sp.]|uniref:Ribonuclease VapC n=1 Tax=Candidatus Jettenia caeni TaxID=247490 RepID=I3IKE8_9BACT|nr:type II toxin-antitoxin system VapC family toxin [Candidatus Jettenia sp. AMX1]MBC6930368.1 type II toxin-antitoxin system VapC family toxin [Candidatus Jettenia sp.]GAB62193.1 conserved hypothetical protein [Candidatus Jettenia caeni]KAA0247485.1 MAG: type II toxin-antitoxin system VapC family toxin [Candidatus Jettenia sp. AMX1]MCE7881964.1 type II toxin-antitoxin system VapC family toxin [Candidatus Jettenia sp. AMX1]MCQ3928522.1 type II toxin-antitoxin system VapC family toxin [Candidat